MDQFQNINKLSRELSKKFLASEMYLVGGAVRDLIMRRTIGDVDVVVRNVPLNALVKFLKTQGDAGLVGKNFGVIKFRPKGQDISLDIALPRTDHAFNTGGYRDVKVAYDHRLPIEKDLERRDFTCNAIALQLSRKHHKESLRQAQSDHTIHYPLITNHSNLVDPFNGLRDIQKKIIRAVGDPEKRFREDYTRMLRALRFSCQLDFQIEKKTWESIRKNVSKINNKDYRSSEASAKLRTISKDLSRQARMVKDEFIIARELVAKEFLKGMYHDPVKMIELMDKSGLLKKLIPELLTLKTCKQDHKWHSEGNVWTHTMLALGIASKFKIENLKLKINELNFIKHFSVQDTLELYLGILFHDLGKPSTFGHEKQGDKKAITNYGHELIGAEMARTICNRLKLSAPEEFRVDPDHVVWLVRNHMLLHPENAKQMRNNTLEKYFFNPLVPGSALLGLCFFDGLSSVPKTRKGMYARYQAFVTGRKSFPLTHKQLKTWISIEGWWTIVGRLKKLSKGQKELPKTLLNGNEIMKILAIKPGPEVGKAIEQLREAQLAGIVKTVEQAKTFLKDGITTNDHV